MAEERCYEAVSQGPRRSAPAALRNREPIADVLGEWLPQSGVVLEIASGTGEHAAYFAARFPSLDWQPSDIHPAALASITAWREQSGLSNINPPLPIDAGSGEWPIDCADAVLSINMVHISPWSAALGLLDGAAKVLRAGGTLILYGPWLKAGMPTAPSNMAFDQQLRERDPAWGLRHVEDFEAEAQKRGFQLEELREMPANNLMLLFRLRR